MGERRVFNKEFKERTIELVKTSGMTKTDTAQDLEVDVNMLCQWKREKA